MEPTDFFTCIQHSWITCLHPPALLASTLSPLNQFSETTLLLPRLVLADFDLMSPHWKENAILLGLFVFVWDIFCLLVWF